MVMMIGSEAFISKGLNTVRIPSSIESIGDRAFANNRLRSVQMPDNLVEYGQDVCANQKIELSYNLTNNIAEISGMLSYTGNAITNVQVTIDDSGVTYEQGLPFYIDGKFQVPDGIPSFTFDFTSPEVSGVAPQGQYSGNITVNLANLDIIQINVVPQKTIYVGDSWNPRDNFISSGWKLNIWVQF